MKALICEDLAPAYFVEKYREGEDVGSEDYVADITEQKFAEWEALQKAGDRLQHELRLVREYLHEGEHAAKVKPWLEEEKV